jgi:CRISPR-associated endonuclease Cas2
VTTYTVSYDLIKRKDYQSLWDELSRLGAHRTQASYWLVNVSNTAKELLGHLKKFVDSDDKIWVSELTRNYDFANANLGTNDWLSKNPPSR